MTIISTKTDNVSTGCNLTTTLPIYQGAITKVKSLNLNKLNTSYSQPANLIPHFWNYKIVDKEGSPDLPCIMILSELFGWFRNLSQSKTYYSTGTALPELVEGKLAVSYEFLSDKLNFNKERIRRNLIKLETLGILTRDVKNIILENGSRINQLYLSIDYEFFKSCFRNPELDIRVGNNDITLSDSSELLRSPLRSGDQISKKNNNRSIISNSIDKDFEDKDSQITDTEDSQQKHSFCDLKKEGEEYKEMTSDTKPLLQQSKQRRLEDFYPLTKEDCSILQSLSKREFSLNAMNEILKNMSQKITNRIFYSKKGFLAYMSQAFRYEKRDAVKTGNTSFKIKANLDEEEQTIQKQEKYLTELEYSLQVSPEWYLKKKLAAVLRRDIAYKILSNYQKSEKTGNIFKIYLTDQVAIGEMDKQIILNQVRATQERVGKNGNIESIEKVEFIFQEKKEKQLEKEESEKLAEIKEKEEIKKFPIWLQIRKHFMDSYLDIAAGIGLDKSWLSKLTACEDNNKISDNIKTLNLKAENKFIRDWINSNYLFKLESIAKELGYNINLS